ncbi:MAG: hypothetical protein HOW73_18610 [Polyangiaceae bacterium]|nr:hypothetical protein [Polyangiaceae bacterium]
MFPLVEGTKYTFRGKRPDGSDDTWTAVLFVIDSSKRLFQYDPHNHVASWFTKAGIKVDSSGIQVVGESLAGDPAPEPALAVAFPITKGAGHEVPGLFVTKYTIAKKESVTVPAGKFEAWKVTIQDKVNPEGAAWLAPGTGLVKIQLPSGRVDELVSVEPAKR